MKRLKLSATALIAILLGALVCLSLGLRIGIPYSYVFSGGRVNFVSPDPYYHMRLVENILQHFPQYMIFDPFTAFPWGNVVGWPPFYTWFLGGIIWLIGLGSPGPHLIAVAGAFFPAVLGALIIIPVFFVGKAVFNRWAGLIAAALIAVSPGEFFGRSILGYTDHHVAEVLFTTVVMLFLVLALQYARRGLKTGWRDCWTDKKLLLYSALVGLFLGIYLLTWTGGLFIVLLLFIYFVVQFVIDTLQGRSAVYLSVVGSLSSFVAFVLVILLLPRTINFNLCLFGLSVAVLVPLLLAFLSVIVVKRKTWWFVYPVILLVLGAAGIVALRFIAPSFFHRIMAVTRGVFSPLGTSATIGEMRPLFFPGSHFSLSLVWSNFTTTFFLCIIAVVLLVYSFVKAAKTFAPEKVLLIVWFFVIFAATVTQVRYSYYLAVEVALLAGYLCWEALLFFVRYFGFDLVAAPPVVVVTKNKKKKKEKRSYVRIRRVVTGIGLSVIILATVLPNSLTSASLAKSEKSLTIPDYWYNALTWLKANSPEPFSSPDAYYQFYTPPAPGTSYKYPASAYSVMAWWDPGNWITEIAHRIPVSNAFQENAGTAAGFFTAQDEASADKIANQFKVKYVIVDVNTAQSQLYVFTAWASGPISKYYETYYQVKNGTLTPVTLFYPAYYSSTFVHLYTFDGKQVAAQSPAVVTWQDKVGADGSHYKQITDFRTFSTYADAQAYVSQHKSDNCRLVGNSPTVSPVSLPALNNYKLVYQTPYKIDARYFGSIAPVKIFQYTKP